MKKIAKLGIIALLLVSLVTSAFAFAGRGFGKEAARGAPEFFLDTGLHNEAARNALEAGDYSAWKEAMVSQLTEERFNQMLERHNRISDNMVERNQGMAEKRAAMQETRENFQNAIQTGNYNMWKEIMANTPFGAKMAEQITEEKFASFVEMHNARQNSDFETAKQIADELGIKNSDGKFGQMKFDKTQKEHRLGRFQFRVSPE